MRNTSCLAPALPASQALPVARRLFAPKAALALAALLGAACGQKGPLVLPPPATAAPAPAAANAAKPSADDGATRDRKAAAGAHTAPAR